MCYLTGSPHEDKEGGKVPKTNNVPPLCARCYDLTAQIYKLHKELLQIQKKIQVQTEVVRNLVKETTEVGQGKCRRDNFLETMAKSGMVCVYVKQLHQVIINEGENAVHFPSRYNISTLKPLISSSPEPVAPEPEASDISASEEDVEVKPESVEDLGQSEIAEDEVEMELEPSCTDSVKSEQFEEDPLSCLKDEEREDDSFNVDSAPEIQKTSKSVTAKSCSRTSKPKSLSKAVKVKKAMKMNTLNTQSCEVCGLKLSLGSSLAAHLKGHVGPQYVYPCLKCGRAYFTLNRLRKLHRRMSTCKEHSEEMKMECDLCPFKNTSKTIKLFKRHLERDHESITPLSAKQLSCPLCNLKFISKQSVELHLEEKHVYTVSQKQKHQFCEICKNRYLISEMAEHLEKRHSIQQPISCRECFAQFASVQGVMSHQREHRKRTKIMFCHLCTSQFYALREYKAHYYLKHGIGEKFNCPQCDFNCYTNGALNSHVKRVHNAANSKGKRKSGQKKKYTCVESECNKEFSSEDLLLQHKILEHLYPPLACSQCSQTFNMHALLRKHVNTTHRGVNISSQKEQQFVCDICSTSFTSHWKLKMHELVKHQTEKPFKCSWKDCPLVFKCEAAVERHVNRTHLRTKPRPAYQRVVCEFCGKSIRKSKLKEHLRIHTSERPYSCDFCGQRFRQWITLKTHVKSHETLGDKFKPKGEMERGVRKSRKKD